jgi:O-antigen/teichoic acid export membrane protein
LTAVQVDPVRAQSAPAAPASLRRILRNTASVLSSDVATRASTFVLYALVARELGAFEFGRISLALSLFYVFQVFAAAGVKTLVTREVARDPARAAHALANGSVVVAVGSALAIGALAAFVALMGYRGGTAGVILLLSLALLPASLAAVCEGVFQGREQMHYIAIANVPVHALKVALAAVLLARGHGVYAIVAVLLGSYVAVACVEWTLMVLRVAKPRARLDARAAVAMVRATAPFLGVDGIVAIMTSLNIVLLSKLADETSVGLYSAAVQLTVPLQLVYQNVVLAVFPLMCRSFAASVDGLRRVTEHLVELVVAVGVPILVLLFFLADRVLTLVYRRDDFAAASDALRVVVWTLLLVAVTSVLGQVLYASLQERLNLRIVAVDAVAAVMLGGVLVARYGVVGAAVAMLLTRLLDCALHYVAVEKRLFRVRLVRSTWRAGLAGAVMAVYLVEAGDHAVWVSAAVGLGIYVVVLLPLMAWPFSRVVALRRRETLV